MGEINEASPRQIRQVVQRALGIERYLLRRAWGLGYAVAAVDIALVNFLPLILLVLGLRAHFGLVANITVNTAISATALVATSWIFKKAYDAMQVRREIADSTWARLLRPWWSAAVWLAYYLPVIAAIVFVRADALLVLLGGLATTVFPFFFALKVSFPEGLPKEAKMALVVYAVCTVLNFAVSFAGPHEGVYLITYSSAVVAFALAFVHARRQKPPETQEVEPATW